MSFSKECIIETLKSDDRYSYNSMADPKHIYPESKTLAITGKKINIALDPISVNVIILSYKK